MRVKWTRNLDGSLKDLNDLKVKSESDKYKQGRVHRNISDESSDKNIVCVENDINLRDGSCEVKAKKMVIKNKRSSSLTTSPTGTDGLSTEDKKSLLKLSNILNLFKLNALKSKTAVSPKSSTTTTETETAKAGTEPNVRMNTLPKTRFNGSTNISNPSDITSIDNMSSSTGQLFTTDSKRRRRASNLLLRHSAIRRSWHQLCNNQPHKVFILTTPPATPLSSSRGSKAGSLRSCSPLSSSGIYSLKDNRYSIDKALEGNLIEEEINEKYNIQDKENVSAEEKVEVEAEVEVEEEEKEEEEREKDDQDDDDEEEEEEEEEEKEGEKMNDNQYQQEQEKQQSKNQQDIKKQRNQNENEVQKGEDANDYVVERMQKLQSSSKNENENQNKHENYIQNEVQRKVAVVPETRSPSAEAAQNNIKNDIVKVTVRKAMVPELVNIREGSLTPILKFEDDEPYATFGPEFSALNRERYTQLTNALTNKQGILKDRSISSPGLNQKNDAEKKKVHFAEITKYSKANFIDSDEQVANFDKSMFKDKTETVDIRTEIISSTPTFEIIVEPEQDLSASSSSSSSSMMTKSVENDGNSTTTTTTFRSSSTIEIKRLNNRPFSSVRSGRLVRSDV